MTDNKWQPVYPMIDTDDIATAPTVLNRELETMRFEDRVSTPLEVYQRARDMIANGWVQHAEAVDADNQRVAPHDERAVKWCVIGSWKGAIYYEPTLVPHDYMYKYLETLWNACNLNYMISMQHPNPPQLNDSSKTDHATIVRCFDKVIAHLIKHPEANTWQPRTSATKK